MQSRRTAPHESAAFVVCAQGLRKACFPGPLDTNIFRPLAGPFFLDCSRTDRVAGGPPARRNLGTQSQGFHLFQESLFSFLPLPSLPPVLLPRFFSFFLNSAIGFSVPNNLTGYPVDCIFKICLFQLTLPDNDHDPAFSFQFSPDLLIPLLVPGNLGHPELGVGFGGRIILTVFVTMPKASVHKNDRTILGQHDIRAAGKALVVHSVTKPLAPKGMTQFPLRCGRGGMYCCHIIMALGRCVVVWHVLQRYDYSPKSTKTFILTDCWQKITTFILS